METTERQAYKQQAQSRKGWDELNSILAERKQLEDQCADLYQQMSRIRRKIGALDERYRQLLPKAEPSVVAKVKVKTPKKAHKPTVLEKAIKAAALKDADTARRLQDLLDGLEV
jgi:chromosome segregation ATPase